MFFPFVNTRPGSIFPKGLNQGLGLNVQYKITDLSLNLEIAILSLNPEIMTNFIIDLPLDHFYLPFFTQFDPLLIVM